MSVGGQRGERRRGDELRGHAARQRSVEDAERPVGVASDAAVAEVDLERERRGRDGDVEVDGFAVALGCERLARRRIGSLGTLGLRHF